MSRNRPAEPNPAALRDFVDAVVALSDDPGPGNLERYLTASRALDDSRPPRTRARSRTKRADTAQPRLQERSDYAA